MACYGEAHDYTVTVTAPPACAAPSQLQVSNIGTSSATVSFTAPPTLPGSAYQYYLSTSSATPTPSMAATGTSAASTIALSTLAAGISYYLWVRSVCASL